MKRLSKMTSKGRVTVPRMRAGDHLSFDEDAKGVRVTVVRREPVQEIIEGSGIQASEKEERAYRNGSEIAW